MEATCANSVLTIRDATREDLPRLVELGRHFREGSTYERFLADNPAKMLELGENLLSKQGLLVVDSDGELVGMMGFVVYDHFISGERVVGEVFWWVEPRYRRYGMKLYKEMKRRGKLAGATLQQMVAPNDKVANFYMRLGLQFVEATYQGKL